MFHREIEFSLLILLGIVVGVFVWSCTPRRSEKMSVVVSILPQKYLVERIAGEAVAVQVMVPAGSSPETYDPTPQDLLGMSRSALYFAVGDFGFERAWLPRFQEQNPDMRMVDTSAGIPRREAGTHEADPHVWTSPENMKRMGRVVCDELVRADTARAALYRRNFERFCSRMDSLHGRMRQLYAIAPCRTFVIYHPALGYLADEFGLRQIVVEQGHKEPSAAGMGRLIEEIRASGARVLLLQQEFDTRLVETLAGETGLRVVRIDPLSEDWETEMMRIVLETSR